MYEPRRVADPTAQDVPDRPRGTEARAAHTPRHAVHGIGDRIFARGGIALAAITASATAGAVVIGSTADPTVAMGAVPAQDSSVRLAAALQQPVSRTLTADQLAAPAVTSAKRATKALISHTPLYTTATVNVRKQASEKAALLGQLQLGVRVSATSEIDGKYRKVEYDDGYGWVLEAQLSDAAPIEAAGTTWDACSRGSAIEGKLRKDTIHIYRSVCALFPAVNSYGGWRAGGLPFHRNGRALDIMLTPRAESALGHRIAKYLIAHAKVFNIDHIIFEQHIWTPSTPRWRKMADRGSLNANHFNHVHVAIRA